MDESLQSPCCRAYAARLGLGPDALCPSCSDYRHFRQDILGKVPNNTIPPDFTHKMYSEFDRNGTHLPAPPKKATAGPKRTGKYPRRR